MVEQDNKTPVSIRKRKKKKKIIIFSIIAFLIVVAIADVAFFSRRNKTENKEEKIMTTTPLRSTIELTVSGSGTVEPLDRYEIVSLVSGDIISSPYEEGDLIKEDAVVYVIDHEEQDKNIESAKNALTKSKIRNKIYLDENEFNKTLEKYTVRAEENGIISDFNLEVDDKINANVALGEIQNFDEIKATIPFNASQFEKIQVGDMATVYLYPSMYTTEGIVSYKSYKTSKSIGGAVVYDIEISIDGSEIALTDTAVSVTVHTAEGDIESPESGTLDYNAPVSIMAEVSGDVLSVPDYIKNGAKVNKGDVLFVIDSSDFLEEKTLAEFEYHDLELNLENAEDKLKNYNIKSPISGTVITKNSKKGDTISGANSNNILMVIADMSAMKFTFQADETDIEKIEIGQEVKVSADAIENKIFYGTVESIATEGTASNGVSYYDVEVVIEDYGQNDESGFLRSGMNVSAEIIYEKSENALCLPVSAVKTIGGESYVFVKNNGTVPANGKKNENTTKAIASDETEPKLNKNEDSSVTTDSGIDKKKAADNQAIIRQRISEATPEGFTAVRVEIGASDGVMIAILSGINEDDVVYIAENDNVKEPVNNQTNGRFTGGMMGGMPRGGIPAGGMMGGANGARSGMGTMR